MICFLKIIIFLKQLKTEDSDDEDELPALYIPEITSDVLWMKYSKNETIWLAMGGYDCGFLYEYDFNRNGPIQYVLMDNALDRHINFYLSM